MGQMYLLILSSMRRMLRNAQKTENLHAYIDRVFLSVGRAAAQQNGFAVELT